jgi:hypothetical protein
MTWLHNLLHRHRQLQKDHIGIVHMCRFVLSPRWQIFVQVDGEVGWARLAAHKLTHEITMAVSKAESPEDLRAVVGVYAKDHIAPAATPLADASLTRLTVNLVPAARRAIDVAVAATGHSRTDSINLALQFYGLAAEVGFEPGYDDTALQEVLEYLAFDNPRRAGVVAALSEQVLRLKAQVLLMKAQTKEGTLHDGPDARAARQDAV